MNREQRVERVAELPFSKLDSQILVVVAKTREVHLLNESAARIWDLLQSPETVVGLVEALTEEYELDPETGEKEVEAAVEEMITKGLLRALPA